MKFYSEILNKTYDTIDECKAAEEAHIRENNEKQAAEAKLKAERKQRAHEIEEARKVMTEAQHNYSKLLNEFVKDYGTYHYSTDSVLNIPHLFFDMFNL